MEKDGTAKPRRLAIVPKQVLRLACVSVVPAFIGIGCTKSVPQDDGGSGGSQNPPAGFGGGPIALALGGFGGGGIGGGPIALAIGGFGGAGFGGGVIILGVGGFAGRPAPPDAGVDEDGGIEGDAALDDEDAGA